MKSGKMNKLRERERSLTGRRNSNNAEDIGETEGEDEDDDDKLRH